MAQVHPSVFMGAVVLDGAQIRANCIVGGWLARAHGNGHTGWFGCL